MDHKLQVYDSTNHRILLANHGTAAGGGEIRNDLIDKIQTFNRVLNYDDCIYITCSLHGLNLTLSSPTTLTMGDGDFLIRDAL